MRRAVPSAVRLVAAGLLGVALAAGTAGCAAISTQATQLQYSPSDGVNVTGTGAVDVRNALIVATEDGSDANFVAAIVNTTDEAQTLTIDYGTDSRRISVPAGTTLSYGVEGSTGVASVEGRPALPLGEIAAVPGATLEVYFQAGDSEGVSGFVPVLDATVDYLETIAPEA